MNTIFRNSEKSKTSNPHRLLLNLSDKINLRRSDEYIALSNLNHILYMKKYKKSCTKIINLKDNLQRGMIKLSYLMDQILYQIFKIILSISSKNMKY